MHFSASGGGGKGRGRDSAAAKKGGGKGEGVAAQGGLDKARTLTRECRRLVVDSPVGGDDDDWSPVSVCVTVLPFGSFLVFLGLL